MTKEEVAQMEHLCRLIQVEKDQHKFNELVAALNDLLDGKSKRLEKASDASQKSKT